MNPQFYQTLLNKTKASMGTTKTDKKAEKIERTPQTVYNLMKYKK